MIDKQNVDRIVALHTENKTKDEEVKELKTEIQTFQSTTAEQLTNLMQHIGQLQQQVQTQVLRKEDEQSQWKRDKDQLRAVSAEQGTPESIPKSNIDKYMEEGRQPAFTFAN